MAVAYNSANWPIVPAIGQPAIVSTPFGTFIPSHGRIVAYVRGTAGTPLAFDGDPPGPIFPTLAGALKQCRSGAGDTVVVLPGHTENFAAADALADLVSGTRILCIGSGGLAPTFRWTATAATVLLNVADVSIVGGRWRMEGASGVVAPITVSAADCAILGADIQTSSGASNLATTPITVAAGADRFVFEGNRVRGVAAGVCTDGISITGAVSDVRIRDNTMIFASGTATGLVRVSADALGLEITGNRMFNITASSVNTVVLNSAGITAVITDNRSAVLTNGTPPAGGILVTSAASAMCCENYTTDASGASGFLDPAVST